MNENKSAEAKITINKETTESNGKSLLTGNAATFSEPMRTKPENQKNSKKAFSFVRAFISTFVTACIMIIAIALIAVKLSGCYIYTVQTGSMSPSYPTGSLVLVKPYDAFEEVEVGDVVTYLLDDEGNTITHRVIFIDEENQELTTQGDANASADVSPVMYANVIGKVVFRIPKIGTVVNVITAEENKNIIVIIIAALFCLSLLFGR